uniref:Ribosomal protein S4 n=1 Tax=Tetraselmis sp. CCMP 881 TaxID=1812852 RepID=A0A650ARF7_9CHLO|nr:ribosomal protein S4 [Tetraselmis sp. CCMP 881]
MVLYQLKSTYKNKKQYSKSKRKSSDLINNNFSYASYLKEKRQFSKVYGKLPLRWFIKYCMNSRALTGKVTNNLLISLERRLDIFLSRIKFTRSIESARQIIIHKKVLVNGIVISSPSYSLKPGDIIQIKEKISSLLYSKNSLMKNIQKKNKSEIKSEKRLEKKTSRIQRYRRKNLRQYPLYQFRPLSCEINYPLSTAIFLYSPQKLYSSYILRPMLFERSFQRTIKK